jgi:putative ABC transport system permease protein
MVLGIAVTTAVFSVADAVLIRPLPFAGSSRSVELFGVLRDHHEIPSLAYPDLVDFRARVRGFEELGIVARGSAVYAGSEPERLNTAEVDAAFLRVLSLRAASGRLFAVEDFAEGSAGSVVLTNGFWKRAFGGDPKVIGRTIMLDGQMTSVVGVLPPMPFMYPTGELDVIRPLRVSAGDGRSNRGMMWAEAIARLRPGVTVGEAQRELAAAAARLAVEFPAANDGISARAKPLRDAVVGPAGRMLALLSLAVAAVLLTACVNVGNLLLAFAATREREFAVRAALGGSATRIRRQVLTESLLVAVTGGMLGIVLAPILTHALIALYPGELPRASEVGLQPVVVAVAVASTLGAALLASIPTLRRASRPDLADGLRGGRGGGISSRSRRIEAVLIATQVAATLTLVFVAALMVRTFTSMNRVDPGFDPSNLLLFRVSPSPLKYPGNVGAETFFSAVDRSLRRLPGVTAVSALSHAPFGTSWFGDVFVREDRGDEGPKNPSTQVTVAAPGFDAALRLRVLEGRSLVAGDDSVAPRVLLVNQTLARKAFPGEDAVGKFVRWNGKDHWRIVGVVADARDGSLIDPAPPMLYAPFTQVGRRGRFIIVRTGESPAQMVPAVRGALRQIDPGAPLTDLTTIDARISLSSSAHRFRAWLIASLGMVACLLALVGIYAIVSQAVTRRTREIGIRVALGQDLGSVRRGVMLATLRIATIGAIVGVGASIGVGRSLASFLYGVSGSDPTLLAAATSLLLASCAAASFLPARRASRIDPVIALRAE